MSIFTAKVRKRRKDGTFREYWDLRENVWDSKARMVRQRFIAHLGKEPVLTEAQASEIASKHGISLDALKKVRRLKIVP